MKKWILAKVCWFTRKCNCTSVQFGCATANRWGWETGGKKESEDVGVTCVNVVANVVASLPSVLWHLLLLWSAHQARMKRNMNVSVSTVVVVAAAHKLRLVLCLCRRAYVAVVPSACCFGCACQLVFHTLCQSSLHNAKAMAMTKLVNVASQKSRVQLRAMRCNVGATRRQ